MAYYIARSSCRSATSGVARARAGARAGAGARLGRGPIGRRLKRRSMASYMRSNTSTWADLGSIS
jgi:hypothetical protein